MECVFASHASNLPRMFWVMKLKPGTNHTDLAWQPELRPAIPTVYGPLDYRVFRDQLLEIDRLLLQGGLEKRFVSAVDSTLPEGSDPLWRSKKARESSLALRCNIARKITGETYRRFAVHASESELLRWFLGIGAVDGAKMCSKSALERHDKILPPERLDAFNREVLAACRGVQTREGAPGLRREIDFDDAYIDATCLKTNIHFPVDWVLLRDAARTLMKATALIRRHGLRNRMPQTPQAFLREMNKLSMAMSASARKTGAKKQRKKILRQMKTLGRKIARHARAHRELLAKRREHTSLSEKQAALITGRVGRVLEQLPAAIKQAHERIIGGRLVPNDKKLLSLYETHTQVIVRGKAGAEVEFGVELLLCETREGLVSDWQLAPGSGPGQLPESIERLKAQGTPPKKVWTDRGLGTKANKACLKKNDIRDGLCERDPERLRERLAEEEGYAGGLRRRGSTEARIAIVKNLFVGTPSRAKGMGHMKQNVCWAVLAHNLWVLARRELAWRKEHEEAKAA